LFVSLLKVNGGIQYMVGTLLTKTAPEIEGTSARLEGLQSTNWGLHLKHFVAPASTYPLEQVSCEVAIWSKKSAKKATAMVFILFI
jgi:hypothetical protein